MAERLHYCPPTVQLVRVLATHPLCLEQRFDVPVGCFRASRRIPNRSMAIRHHCGMRTIGIRLWASKLAFVALEDGDGFIPTVVERWHGPMPKDMTGPERLDWVYRETSGAIARVTLSMLWRSESRSRLPGRLTPAG